MCDILGKIHAIQEEIAEINTPSYYIQDTKRMLIFIGNLLCLVAYLPLYLLKKNISKEHCIISSHPRTFCTIGDTYFHGDFP
jgi:hypothetical protein